MICDHRRFPDNSILSLDSKPYTSLSFVIIKEVIRREPGADDQSFEPGICLSSFSRQGD